MIICGFEKFSMVDYDGKIACTIFTKGCNFRCPFCHNSSLVESKKHPQIISENSVFDYLNKRKKVIDAVCISGGEPTLQPDLIDFVKKIKNLGFLVKLDTNGYNPDAIKQLLNQNLLDYVAMDIKNCKEKYDFTIGAEININKIEQSIELIKNSNIDYEFRTTLISQFHTENDILKIGKWLENSKNYFLQKYVDNDDCIKHGFDAINKTTVENYIKILKPYINNVETRGFN